MVVSGRDGGHAAAQAADLQRRVPGLVRAVAQLAVVVVAPALGAPRCGQRTAVVAAGRDGGHAAAQAADLQRRVPGLVRAVAQLAVVVVAPALGAPRCGQRTAVGAAARDGGHAAAQAADLHRRVPGLVRAVAQLAEAVVAPALDAPRRGQRTAVDAADRDGGHAAAQAADLYRRVPVEERAVAQLAVVVAAPALDAPRRGQRTAVEAAGCYPSDIPQRC